MERRLTDSPHLNSSDFGRSLHLLRPLILRCFLYWYSYLPLIFPTTHHFLLFNKRLFSLQLNSVPNLSLMCLMKCVTEMSHSPALSHGFFSLLSVSCILLFHIFSLSFIVFFFYLHFVFVLWFTGFQFLISCIGFCEWRKFT